VASVHIITRRLSSGERRFIVRFRTGGREAALLHGGSFKTKTDAAARARWIAGELAARRVPDLRALEPLPLRETLGTAGRQWTVSRIDVSEATRNNYTKHMTRWGEMGERRVDELTSGEIQEWIVSLADLKASSVKRYVTTLRQVLDFAGIVPNPARDVRLPKVERTEIEPPSAAEVDLIVQGVRPRWRLPIRVLEATAMRVGEMCDLRWEDVDARGSRFRVRSGKTRAARRWVQVPEGLMVEVDELVPREDRVPERFVFGGMTGQDLRQAMGRACQAAGIPRYSPHDLRHRRVSIWHHEGVPLREIAARVGHARTSLTVDTYTHVILVEEA
jgi:integrase/recombinase XerD